jgi:branched-chain amino acid transport system substrate-binding protein
VLSKGTAVIAALVAAAVVAACGGDDDGGGGEGGGNGGGTLTVYSSLPAQGDNRPETLDMIRGIRMAIADAGGRAGKFGLNYEALDDATASAGKWDAAPTSTNARKAVTDDKAIAYIGEFNSGASAISIPITNEGGLLQVSPANTAIGLTRSEGADKGEPEKYYPTGTRTFGRIAPADHIQAAAQVTYMKQEGCQSVYILNDKEVYGQGLAKQVEKIGSEQDLDVKGNEGFDTKAANFRSVAATIESSGADCFFFGGISQNKGVQVFKDVFAANPNLKMFAPDGAANTAFTSKLGPRVEKVVHLTSPTLDPKFYPAAAQEFFKEFEAKHGKKPEPYAVYGYEAMSVVIDAIKRAGDKGDDREAVVAAFFQTRNRKSALGTYDIDKNGDTTLSDYGGYRVEKGALVFGNVIKAQS